MKYYLTYAPILIFIIWLYIVIQGIKSFKEFKKTTGQSNSQLFNPLSILNSVINRNPRKDYEVAFKKHKETSKTLLLIWIASLILFVMGAITIGIISAI